MYLCRNRRGQECNDEVIQVLSSKEIKEGEPIPIWPVGEKLIKYDDICKNCESRLFEIEEKECPVCGATDFNEIEGIKLHDNEDKKVFENSYLKFKLCETRSVLQKRF